MKMKTFGHRLGGGGGRGTFPARSANVTFQSFSINYIWPPPSCDQILFAHNMTVRKVLLDMQFTLCECFINYRRHSILRSATLDQLERVRRKLLVAGVACNDQIFNIAANNFDAKESARCRRMLATELVSGAQKSCERREATTKRIPSRMKHVPKLYNWQRAANRLIVKRILL